MLDQDLRDRQHEQYAGAGCRIHHRHRGGQPPAEPAPEQDRVRHVADAGDGETQADADGELKLPQFCRIGRSLERAAEQRQAEREHRARAGAVEQPADQRRGEAAAQGGQRIDRNHLGAVPAERLRDRLEEHGKTLGEPAPEHRQEKAHAEHGEAGAPGGLLGLRGFGGAGGLGFHGRLLRQFFMANADHAPTMESAFRRP